MTDRTSSPNLLRSWRAMGVPVDDELRDALSERTVVTIAATIRVSSANRSRRRWTRLLLAAAGVAGAALAAYTASSWRPSSDAQPAQLASPAPAAQPTRAQAELTNEPIQARDAVGTVMLDSGGSPTILESGARVPLAVGDALTTPKDGNVTLELAHRGQVKVLPTTEISLVKDSPKEHRLRVRAGRVDVDVPKLQPERRLVLDTPDAEVTVVGTAFEVGVAEVEGAEYGTHTTVRVHRGVVHVARRGRAGALVRAGESWDSQSGASTPMPSVKRSRPPARSGTLRAENALFRAAVDARNAGDDARAVALLESLLQKYPDTVLGQEAQLELSRARARLIGATLRD